MKHGLIAILLLTITACGGSGNSGAGGDTAQRQERLKSLKQLTAEAEQKFPELTDYEALQTAGRGKRDGGKVILKAVEDAAELSFKKGSEPWRGMLAFGLKSFEEGQNRSPTDAELQEALDRSARISKAMDELRGYDTIFVFSLLEDDSAKGFDVLLYFQSGFARVEMLVALGEVDMAAHEEACVLEVLSKIDWKVCPTAANRKAMLSTTQLTRLLAGELAPLESDSAVVDSLELLREDPVKGFKRTWRLFIAQTTARIKRAQSAEDLWFLMKVADEFPDHAPDPYDPTEYKKARTLAFEAGGESMQRTLGGFAVSSLQERQIWLAWDLFRADQRQPLLDQRAYAEEMIKNAPYTRATWGDSELAIEIAPDCPFLADLGNARKREPIRLALRPKAK